jgi:hypothetical protein
MDEIIHIIPSGSTKTMCGLNAKNAKGSSLGMECTCDSCWRKAQSIVDKIKECKQK